MICPSLAREYTQSYYALRLVAEGLCGNGLVVLRFDYDGTGDSAGGFGDPDRVPAWLGSVAAAVRLVRSTGVTQVSLVGLRIGATLAAEAASSDGAIDQLVLWDPCLSGASFVRNQKALASLTLGITSNLPDGSVEIPGAMCSAAMVQELRGLRLDRLAGPVARRVLGLTRPSRIADREALGVLGREAVETMDAPEQEALLDVGPPFQKLPHQTIADIVAWVSGGAVGDPTVVSRPEPAGPVVVATDEAGTPVVERPCSIGPAGLFGVLTEVPGTPKGPVAVLLSVANEPHTGPSRLWVDFARRWAPLGIRSVRVDLSGIGDSPVRTEDQEAFVARPPEAFSDVEDVVREMRELGSGEVVLVGICSAAYQALDSALELHPTAIVVVSPVLSFVPPEYGRGLKLDERRRVMLPRTAAATVFRDTVAVSTLRRRFPGLRRKVRQWAQPGRPLAPFAARAMSLRWQLRFVRRPAARPSSWLPALVRGGTDVLFVANERDSRSIRFGTGKRFRARLAQTGRFRFEYLPDLEHALLVEADRQRVAQLVTDHLTTKLSVSPPRRLDAQAGGPEVGTPTVSAVG